MTFEAQPICIPKCDRRIMPNQDIKKSPIPIFQKSQAATAWITCKGIKAKREVEANELIE